MKKIIKRIAALLVAAALIATMGTMSVFAEAAEEEWTDADTQELLAYLEENGISMPSGTDISGSDISGTDLPEIDTTKNLSEYTIVEKNYPEYGVSFKAAELDLMGDIYSDVSQLSLALGADVGATALYDISYGGFSNYILYSMAQDSGVMMAVTYTESNWSRFIGNYADLSAEDQDRIAAGSDLMGLANGTTAAFRVINGVPCLVQEFFDSEYTTMVYMVQAVVDGGMYEVYIQMANPVDADFDVADEIIDSLKFKGVNPQRYGTASTATTNWLIALVAVLFAVVALLAFFVIRFSMFAKASGSEFNIIGFNLPEKKQ